MTPSPTAISRVQTLVLVAAFIVDGCGGQAAKPGLPSTGVEAGTNQVADAEAGGRDGAGEGGRAGATADAAADGAGGADAGDAAGGCPSWPGCTGAGGRGNVCGGVVADERFLQGSGFEKFEGARIVGSRGHAVVSQGAFILHLGSYGGCGSGVKVTYRIDVSANGHCDDDVDLVYTAVTTGGFEASKVTGADPGTRGTCADLPAGYDLDLTVAPGCLPGCGAVNVGLFETGDKPLVGTLFYLDGAWTVGRGFGGALIPGHQYRVRYYWSPSPFGFACATPPVWSGERALAPTAGVNRFEIAVNSGAPASACF